TRSRSSAGGSAWTSRSRRSARPWSRSGCTRTSWRSSKSTSRANSPPVDLPSRIPPHNLDAERAVLGALLLEGRETLPRVIEVLRPPDFYTEAHRVMYATMLRLFDRGEPVDLITLSEELRRAEQLEFVGGPAALALLVEQASIAAHLIAYAQIVRDMGTLRELIQTSTQLITEAFEAKQDVQTLIDDAERKIFALAERRLQGSAVALKEILHDTFKYIEHLYQRQERITGIATGITELDEKTAGLQASDFHRRQPRVVGSRSAGKGASHEGRAWARSRHRRLPAAHAWARGARQSTAGDFGNITLTQSACEGAQRACRRALPAIPGDRSPRR